MPRFEACLLDYGNTIIEFDRMQIDSVQRGLAGALGEILGPADPAAVSGCLEDLYALPYRGDPPEYRELTPHDQMRRLLEGVYGEDREFPPEMIERCDLALQEHFVRATRIDAETVEFLDGLRRRMHVGLVSNYPCGKSLRRSLRHVGIDHLLSPIVVSGDVGYVKPHGSVFAAALAELPVPPERTLFVGDRWDADMIGARDAGMKTCHHIGFTSDLDLEERYAVYRPDYQIRRLEELEGILWRSNGRSMPETEAAAGGIALPGLG